MAAATQQSATDLAALALAQQQDTDLMQFVANYAAHKWTFGKVALPDSPSSVLCELSRPVPLVPSCRPVPSSCSSAEMATSLPSHLPTMVLFV